ncbi:hypothetical protein J6590_072083 [Homalodisca vitripennis]|nr:hypothetical protein J6590_072083 [Homalodisca vitripennis]
MINKCVGCCPPLGSGEPWTWTLRPFLLVITRRCCLVVTTDDNNLTQYRTAQSSGNSVTTVTTEVHKHTAPRAVLPRGDNG